jgi:hypothetical protein
MQQVSATVITSLGQFTGKLLLENSISEAGVEELLHSIVLGHYPMKGLILYTDSDEVISIGETVLQNSVLMIRVLE